MKSLLKFFFGGSLRDSVNNLNFEPRYHNDYRSNNSFWFNPAEYVVLADYKEQDSDDGPGGRNILYLSPTGRFINLSWSGVHVMDKGSAKDVLFRYNKGAFSRYFGSLELL
jgi:hypothetical protein